MELRTYLDGLPHGGMTAFAKSVGISAVYLSQLAAKQDGRVPSPRLSNRIEKSSGGAVTRKELRPTDFWEVWTDLAPPTEQTATST